MFYLCIRKTVLYTHLIWKFHYTVTLIFVYIYRYILYTYTSLYACTTAKWDGGGVAGRCAFVSQNSVDSFVRLIQKSQVKRKRVVRVHAYKKLWVLCDDDNVSRGKSRRGDFGLWWWRWYQLFIAVNRNLDGVRQRDTSVYAGYALRERRRGGKKDRCVSFI